MFRRKKTKGSKSKASENADDMVAPLTGPDILSSSFSSDPVVTKISIAGGGSGRSRFLPGRRQKNKIGEEVAEDARHTRTMGTQQPVVGAQANDTVVGKSSQPRRGQEQQRQQQQHQHISKKINPAAPQAARLNNNRPSQSVAVANELIPFQPSSTTQHQLSSTDELRKFLEMRDDHEKSRRPHHGPSTVITNSTRRDVRSISDDITSGRPSLFPPNDRAMATTILSNPPHLFVNKGGGEEEGQRQSGTSSGDVPRSRSGWSIQSNGSSAMNSEHYIQSLNTSPALRGGKVSLLVLLCI